MFFYLVVTLAVLPFNVADITGWPTPAEVFAFGKTLEGDLLVGGEAYYNATIVNNFVYHSFYGAVVMSQSVDDVVKAVQFADKFNLSVTVLSSGHCYVGRSSGDGTLNINLKGMTKMQVNMADPESDTGSSITTETGNAWLEIYKEVDKYNKVVVGGSAHTVSPGGYILGGGHSPMTRKLGLGVDSVVKINMVTAKGNLLEVNYKTDEITMTDTDGKVIKYKDADLQWALLGGGPGFGVVTSYTLKMHEPPSGFTRILVTWPLSTNLTGVVGDEVLRHLSDYLANDITHEWSGYIIVNNHRVDTKIPGNVGLHIDGFVTLSMLHFGPYEQAYNSIKNLYEFRPDLTEGTRQIMNYTTFLEYEKTVTDAINFRQYIGNRFIQKADLLDTTKYAEKMMNVLNYTTGVNQCTGILVGGRAAELASDEGIVNPTHESAVSPDFRSAIIAMTCGTGWEDESRDNLYINSMRDWFKTNLYTIGKGSYFNEPDYYIEDWKTSFWGSMDRYNRLLNVKKRYDPEHMFWCHHCVGSDLKRPSGGETQIKCTSGTTGIESFIARSINMFCMLLVTCFILW